VARFPDQRYRQQQSGFFQGGYPVNLLSTILMDPGKADWCLNGFFGAHPTLGFVWNIGPVAMLVLMVVALIIFGKRLPEVARNLGKGIVEFKKGVKGIEDDVDNASSSYPQQQYPQQQQQYPQQQQQQQQQYQPQDQYQYPEQQQGQYDPYAGYTPQEGQGPAQSQPPPQQQQNPPQQQQQPPQQQQQPPQQQQTGPQGQP